MRPAGSPLARAVAFWAALAVIAWCLGSWLGQGEPYREGPEITRELELLRMIELDRAQALGRAIAPPVLHVVPPVPAWGWVIATDTMMNAEPRR